MTRSCSWKEPLVRGGQGCNGVYQSHGCKNAGDVHESCSQATCASSVKGPSVSVCALEYTVFSPHTDKLGYHGTSFAKHSRKDTPKLPRCTYMIATGRPAVAWRLPFMCAGNKCYGPRNLRQAGVPIEEPNFRGHTIAPSTPVADAGGAEYGDQPQTMASPAAIPQH